MRYIRLWWQFFKMSLMAESEYRLNFVIKILGEIFWYTAQLSVFEVLYTHTSTLNGWTISDVRVFMGSLFLSDVLYMIFFQENLDHLSRLVRRGELDLLLAKPINSQFMVSCRKVAISNFGNLVLVIGYFVWAVSRLPQAVGPTQFLAFGILVLCGVMITYSMRLLFSMLVLIVHEASNIQFIWYQLYRLGTRPDVLYPTFLRYLIYVAIPVAFIASVPARMLIHGVEARFLLGGLGAASFIFCLTTWLWNRALRQYSSASS